MTAATTAKTRVRLQKYLADSGVASRRRAEELILLGRVLVNDQIVDELPAFVDPRRDKVIVDGDVLRSQKLEYFIVNKPKGVVCTNRDPAGRPRAVDLLPPIRERLFVVGRLDADSTGLLLMTNDGELAERITHPRFGVAKTYRAEVDGRAAPELLERMKKGIYLSAGKVVAEDAEIVHCGKQRSVLHITLHEGRNRQVRRMLARLGHKVRSLKRLSIGPLSVKRLPPGASRRLSARELDALRTATADAAAQAATSVKPRKRRPAKAAARRPSKAPARPPKSAAPKRARKTTAKKQSDTPRRRIVK